MKRQPSALYISLRHTIKSLVAIGCFLFEQDSNLSFLKRWYLISRFLTINRNIECQHYDYEMLEIVRSIVSLPTSKKGVIVEAGAYKGGSTAKLSIVAKLTGRKLIVFDSFEGLPSNYETYTRREGLFYIYGKTVKEHKPLYAFHKGQYSGDFQEVKNNIRLYGSPEVCEFKKGFFESTMKHFNKPIVAIFIDVDLASSTRTCLMNLYPLLQSGGILFSHDGHLTRVLDVYKNKTFWKKEINFPQPFIEGLDKRRLLKIVKE